MPDTPTWGPALSCPDCGATVQRLAWNGFLGGFRTYEVESAQRHVCPVRRQQLELGATFECFCGVVVYERRGVRYDERTGSLHACPPRPLSAALPPLESPEPPAIPLPRGVLNL